MSTIKQTRPPRPWKKQAYPFCLRPGEVKEQMDVKHNLSCLRSYNYEKRRPRPLRLWITTPEPHSEPCLCIMMQNGPGKGKPLRPADKILFDHLEKIPGAYRSEAEGSPLICVPLSLEVFALIPQYDEAANG